MSLAGLHILVTRPKGQGEALMAAIAAAGGRAWHYPVLEINGLERDSDPASVQRCKQLIMDLDQFQQVIFVSTNAVKYGLHWIDQYWAQLPVGIQWYGVGKATSDALRQAGFPVVTQFSDGAAQAMNSEALLQHEALQQLAKQKVLIVRGVGGRDYLAAELQQRGALVSTAECYRRALVDRPQGEIVALIRQQAITVLCVNSGESLQNVSQLAGDKAREELQQLKLLVPGERVAGLAKLAGFRDIVVAENASDAAVVAALQSVQSDSESKPCTD